MKNDISNKIMNEEDGLKELQECTLEIRHGLLGAMRAIIPPLEKVRVKKLYVYAKDDEGRQLYDSFEDYTKAEFGFARSYFSKLKCGFNTMLELEQRVDPGIIDKVVSPRAAYEISQLPEDSREAAIKELAAEAGKRNITAKMVHDWKEEKMQASTDQMPKRHMEQLSFFDDDTETLDGDAQAEVLTSESDISANAILVNADEDADMPEGASSDTTLDDAEENALAEDADDMEGDSDEDNEEDDDEEYEDDEYDEEESDEDDTDEMLDKLQEALGKLARMIAQDERNRDRLLNHISKIFEDFGYNVSEYIQYSCE